MASLILGDINRLLTSFYYYILQKLGQSIKIEFYGFAVAKYRIDSLDWTVCVGVCVCVCGAFVCGY